MLQFSRVIIIYNPNSTGRARKLAEQLQGDLALRLPRMHVELQQTKYAGHAIQLAYQAAHRYPAPLIVSASGDGGYNEVINGAINAQQEGARPVCAVLPSGNANDHARTLHHAPLADLIVAGKTSHLDLLKLETTFEDMTHEVRYAHAYVGLGLTPTVAVELNKHKLNSIKESLIVFRTIKDIQPVVIRRGNKVMEIDSLICSNVPEMAKVLTLSSSAQPDDGMFEVTVFRHKSTRRLLTRLVRGLYSDLGASSREKAYVCTVLQSAPVQLDGEVIHLRQDTGINISICPGLLKTLVSPPATR